MLCVTLVELEICFLDLTLLLFFFALFSIMFTLKGSSINWGPHLMKPVTSSNLSLPLGSKLTY